MGIDDLLGLGAPGGNPFGMTTQYADGTSASAQPQQPAQQAAPAYQQPHGIKAFLGMLGDAMLVAHGKEPMYQNRVNQERENAALSGFLTNPDQAIQQLMQIDPKSGIQLYGQMHPPSEHTMEQKVYEYEQSLPPEQRPAFERSIQLTHPGMGTPLTVEAGTIGPDGRPIGVPANVPTVASQADYDKLPLGSPYRDAQGRVGTKGGGTASNPSATFPGR